MSSIERTDSTVDFHPGQHPRRVSQRFREGQSFSQVIKEHFSGKKTGRDLQAVLREIQISEGTLDAIDEQVKAREAHPAKAPKL